MVKVTKSTADIAEALEHGGLKHSSKDFFDNGAFDSGSARRFYPRS